MRRGARAFLPQRRSERGTRRRRWRRPLLGRGAPGRRVSMRARWLLVALLAGPACSATSTPSTRIVSPRAPAPLAASANASPASPVFVEDDYPKALAQARALGKPLFVDAWAPWCHTCLSMRAYVFPNEAMRPLSNDFV